MNITDQFLSDYADTAITHVRSGGEPVSRTYAQLKNNVTALSTGLRNLGIAAGDRVLIIADTSLSVLETILAVMRIGATVIPQTPMTGAAMHRAIIRAVRPVCCVFDDPLQAEVEADLAESCRHFIRLRKSADARHVPFESLLAGSTSKTDARADVSPHQEALIVYSSGSQGDPKGIRMTHEDLQSFFELHDFMHTQYSEPGENGYPRSPFISVLPLNHLAGIAMSFNGLWRQRPTFLMNHFIPSLYLRTLEQCRSTVLMIVPSMYTRLLEEPAFDTTDVSCVRYCITMGEPCTPALASRIAMRFGSAVINAYGLTECFTGLGHMKSELLAGRIPHGAIGRHLFGKVKLVDEAGNESTTAGELWLRNKTVRACYTVPAMNAARLRDGWFATGDLFERDATGEFYHRGRADDMFICNGRNIYPVEIESVLAQHPLVQHVCAAPIRNREGKTVPAVLLVSRGSLAEADVIDHAARHGASHAVPQLVSFADRLPEVGPGKVNRKEVGRLLQSLHDRTPAGAVG